MFKFKNLFIFTIIFSVFAFGPNTKKAIDIINSTLSTSFEISGVEKGLFNGVWNYLDSDNTMKEAGAKYGTSFTYKGFSEYNSASVWENGNDTTFGSGTGGAAVTKVTTGETFGQSSAYLVSGAVLNDWVSISFNASGVDELNEISFKYSVATTGHWEMRVTCDAPIIDASNDDATLWSDRNKGRATYTNVASNTICIMGFQCVSAVCDDIRFNNMSVSSQVDSRVNLIEQEGTIFDFKAGFGSVNTLVPYFTNVRSDTSGNIYKYVNNSTDGLVFTALRDAVITMTFTSKGSNALSRYATITKNLPFPITAPGSSYRNTDNIIVNDYIYDGAGAVTPTASASFEIKAGDTWQPHNDFADSYKNSDVRVALTATALSEKVSHATDTSDVDIVVEASGNSETSITDGVTPLDFIEVKDTVGAWDGTVFTVPEDGDYKFMGMFNISSNLGRWATLFVDSGSGYVAKKAVTEPTVANIHVISGSIFLNKGNKVQLRLQGGNAVLVNSSQYHHLSITKQKSNAGYVVVPTEENEIQEKILSGYRQSDGVISDLTFTGLEIGRKYKISGQFDLQVNVATASNPTALVEHLNGATQIGRTLISTSGNVDNISTLGFSYSFTATDSTVTFSGGSLTSTSRIRGDGTREMTFVQLQKLPDESGLVTGKFAKVRTCYLTTNSTATTYATDIPATTSYKDRNTYDLIGDCGFASVVSNRLNLNQGGKYNFSIPVSAYSGSGWLDLRVRNNTSGVNQDLNTVSYSAASQASLTPVNVSIDISNPSEYTFQTKSGNSTGLEFIGRITIQQILAR